MSEFTNRPRVPIEVLRPFSGLQRILDEETELVFFDTELRIVSRQPEPDPLSHEAELAEWDAQLERAREQDGGERSWRRQYLGEFPLAERIDPPGSRLR